ncbi:hypothetical protein [Bacillus mojavensis]|uniref:hypothetical protein n=1 Tax=Bacillus mojavensis TaxID=72360 RepID=UPI00398B4398
MHYYNNIRIQTKLNANTDKLSANGYIKGVFDPYLKNEDQSHVYKLLYLLK